MIIAAAIDEVRGSGNREVLHRRDVKGCGRNQTMRRRTLCALFVGCLIIVVRPVQASPYYTIGPAEVTACVCQSPRTGGVVVEWRDDDSPLGRAGVPAGAVIVTYGRRRITTAQECLDAIQAYGTNPVEVAALSPLREGDKPPRHSKTYLVTAVPKDPPDARPGGLAAGRAYVFCIVGPSRKSSDYAVALQNAHSVCDDIRADPISQRAQVRIVDDWREGVELRQWIARELTDFCRRVTKDDAVLVYFCGHGGYNPKRYRAEGHIIELDSFGPSTTYLWRSDLMEMLPRNVRLRGLITDSCFSLAAIDPGKGHYEQRTETLVQEYPSTWQKLLLHSSGVVSLNGCSKNQMAWSEPDPPNQMIFTRGLLLATRQPVADWPDFIEAATKLTSRRFREVRHRLPPDKLDGQVDQVPQIFADEHRVTTMAVASKGSFERAVDMRVWMKDE